MARASPFASRGPSLAGDSAQNRHAGRATDSQSSDVTRRLSAFTHAATPTAIVGLYNWFGQTYILGRLSLVHISLFLPRPAYNPNDNPFGYGFPS
jgi:hypothetical protein